MALTYRLKCKNSLSSITTNNNLRDHSDLKLNILPLQEMKDLRSQNWDLEYIEQYFLAKVQVSTLDIKGMKAAKIEYQLSMFKLPRTLRENKRR